MGLAHELLASLLVDATWPLDASASAERVPPLPSVLANARLWANVRQWCKKGGVLGRDSTLVRLLAAVSELLSVTAADCLAERVSLKTLGALSNAEDFFGELLRCFDAPVEGLRDKLGELVERKKKFDSRLHCCQV